MHWPVELATSLTRISLAALVVTPTRVFENMSPMRAFKSAVALLVYVEAGDGLGRGGMGACQVYTSCTVALRPCTEPSAKNHAHLSSGFSASTLYWRPASLSWPPRHRMRCRRCNGDAWLLRYPPAKRGAQATVRGLTMQAGACTYVCVLSYLQCCCLPT